MHNTYVGAAGDARGSASSKLTDEELQPQGTPEGDEPQVLGPEATGGDRRVTGEVMTFTLRSSPYPTPEDLAAYERIHPGFTDRMLTLTERETDHRISQEHFQTCATIRLASRGQYMAFIVVMTLVSGGIAGVLTGHSLAGFAGIVVAAATLVGAFVAPDIFARRRRRRDEQEHSDAPSSEARELERGV
jgi:uncharacterized membrane protein